MKKRIVSILLAVIMLLGMIPTGFIVPQAEAAETPEPIVIDFKESAKEAAKQTFWVSLKDATGSKGTSKVAGVINRVTMSTTESAAYDSLRTYLWENHGWTIDEDTSYLKSGSVNKAVWFNDLDAVDWGLAYLSGGFNTNDIAANGSRLNLTVNVETAGYYSIVLDAYHCSNNGNLGLYTGVANGWVGSGYADILVNGNVVKEAYAFTTYTGSPNASIGNASATIELDDAYFNAGANTITINTVKDYAGNTSNMRRTIFLNSMELEYISSGLNCDCEEFTYIPNEDGTHKAVCVDCETETKEDCTDEDADRVCDVCEGTIPCEHDGEISYVSNDDRTHAVICEDCEEELKDEACTDEDSDFVCDFCDGSLAVDEMELAVTVLGAEKQVARNTIQKFEFELTDAYSGDAISLSQATISYETDVDDIIEIDEENHTFRTLENGDVTVTVTAVVGEVEATATVELTVADVGENRFVFTDPTFEEDGVDGHWPTQKTGFNFVSVEEESDGNMALKLSTNPYADFGTNNAGSEVKMNNGYLAEVYPGHLYELSFKVKTEDYKKAEGAAGDLKLDVAMWDYKTNATSSLHNQILVQQLNLPLNSGEWTEIRLAVKAPLTGDAPVYITPRIVLRPTQYNGADKTVSGWEETVWFDDFCVREVGFDSVELVLNGNLKDTVNQSTVTIKPVTTSGDYINIASGSVSDMVSFTSTNEDAMKIVAAPTLVSNFPTATIKRVTIEEAAELKAEVTIYGVTQEATIDVPMVDLSQITLETVEVTIPGVEKQVARNTIQKFEFEMVDTEGEAVLPAEVDISYRTDVPGIVEIDEENHTFRTLKNGDVTVTITATKNGKSISDTIALTVADVGENRFINSDPTMEAANAAAQWTTYDKKFNTVTVADDGSGSNKALKIVTNPNVSMDDVANAGSIINMNSGYFAELLPGHMYEMSAMVKIDDYVQAEGSDDRLQLDFQMFDYKTNANISANLLNKVNGAISNVDVALGRGEWTEVRFAVKAPPEMNAPVYIMPRIVLRPRATSDYDISGWNATVWFDDFSIREVGLDHVELSLEEQPTDTVTPVKLIVKPYPTSGTDNYIDIAANDVANVVSLISTNENVVVIEEALKRVMYTTSPLEYLPVGKIRLVGRNEAAELVAKVTIHGVTEEAKLDMTQTDLPELLRDIRYTLDGFETVALKSGEKAEGVLIGRTTQREEFTLTEAQLRKSPVYFVSSNTKVAIVDQATGDVTCVGEGTATISAYVLKEGITASDSVVVTVTDDTDLASMEISSAVDYVGVNNTMQLTLQGKKASGANADMSKYPIAWTVDKEDLAKVDSKGRLTGLKPGTVNVTATVGVMRTAVTDTITIEVVPNTDLVASDVVIDFTYGNLKNIQEATIEEDGVQINRSETYQNGANATIIYKYGFAHKVPVGGQLAFDFVVKRDGWYRIEAGGGQFSAGNISEVYVDEYYGGNIDFFDNRNGYPYDARLDGNTVYLEAGVHTFYVKALTEGTQYLGLLALRAAEDPNPLSVEVSTSKDSILVGETMDLKVKATDANGRTFYLKYETAQSDKTNYYMTASATPAVATVSGNTITGVKEGSATVNVTVSVNGEVKTYPVNVKVVKGTIASATLTAEKTTFAPNGGSEQLKVTYYNVAGQEIAKPSGVTISYETSDAAIASVSDSGVVTAGSKEGSARVVATITEGEHTVEAAVWITVTTGKIAPTIYTMEERANAKENALRYSWAADTKNTATDMADYIIKNLDLYYEGLIRESLPRTCAVYREKWNGVKRCAYCDTAIEDIYGVYCWEVDPINNPWKITCPHCHRSFPSNDFEKYYKAGLDERGYFSHERALANGGEQYLVNELYPEMGDGWGVDNGSGWLSGNKLNGIDEAFNYIAYYTHMAFYPRGEAEYGLLDGLKALADAYVYTGDEKYGAAGVKLLTRVAEIYPEYDMSINTPSGIYLNSDGSSGLGKLVGAIWEGAYIAPLLAKASDALWPAMANDAAVQAVKEDAVFYGVDPETITTEYLRNKVDNGILLQIRDAILSQNNAGNFGMEQSSMVLAAVALDRLPETEEMINWAVQSGDRISKPTPHATGGNVYSTLVNLIDRNGFGNEVSYTYNRLWFTRLMDMADALADYSRVESANLWEFPKFVEMFRAFGRNIQGGHGLLQFGEAGAIQVPNGVLDMDAEPYFIPAFQNTGDVLIAQMIYAGNGNSVTGLHADIFTKNPESGLQTKIQDVIKEYGELDMSKSANLSGYGLAALRTGPAKFLGKNVNGTKYFHTTMFYGPTGASHGQLEALSLDVFAFGLSMTSNLGYPTVVNSSSLERTQWVMNTVSHNTVVVDDAAQQRTAYAGLPMHYDDADQVKLIDADSSGVYAQTDIYRRTAVVVKAPNGVPYTVDFFRILGGEEHVYSFHANSTISPKTEGLDFIYQPMGSYAGPDIPYGNYIPNPEISTDGTFNIGNGYSWLKEVYRDGDPATSFSVDWQVEDFRHQLVDSRGLHMKLMMLSEEPMTEVALADGIPPQDGENPETLKYLLVRRSGEAGMDTLFTSVIETYQYDNQIASSELVKVKLIDGTEGLTDRASAIKVTMLDGRVDYIVYATNPDCTYKVDNRFTFSGFVGVCSYYGDNLFYAYGNEATEVADVVTDATAAITGKIVDFTKGLSMDGYTITISAEQDLAGVDFAGRCIYVENDGLRNAVYQIADAKVNGNTVILDIGHETLVRSYLDDADINGGYVYDIAEGAQYTIPLSNTMDAYSIFTYVKDKVVKAGNKVNLTAGVANSGATYELVAPSATGMTIDSKTGAVAWTTSKSLAGRHPITVKATSAEGETYEMTFVLYVVDYTGSAYTPAQCKHAKAVTYNVTNENGDIIAVETACPACGTITKEKVEVDDGTGIKKFNLVGANMTLGNELRLNFMAYTTDIQEGYKAVITHNGQKTEATFAKYNNSYSSVSYAMPAKKMADTITVEVFDKDGNAVSNLYTDSVRSYAMRMLEKNINAKTNTLLVDMLNYGAAAQKHFEYNANDLANAQLTKTQKSKATKVQTCKDRRVQGENYYGSNLSLENQILLNLYFKNVTPDMYAEITFTDFRGRPQKIDVTYKEFKRLNDTTYGVAVDDIVLGDSFCLVTVTVYNADGTVYGTATDSVESYCARQNPKNRTELYNTIMQFAVGAKAYLS